jgi:CheY-like chemotaxis protein
VVAANAPLVLVVDDDRGNLDSLERIFAKEGLRVKGAPND